MSPNSLTREAEDTLGTRQPQGPTAAPRIAVAHPDAGPVAPVNLPTRPEPRHRARIVVAIPSTGRPGILPDTVRAISLQDRLPDRVVLSVAAREDIGDLDCESLPFQVQCVFGPKGATRQRNRVIDLLLPGDILLLLDDDFLMAPDYLRRTLDVFAQNPDVVLATGTVLLDGILGPGYDHAEGARRLNELSARPAEETLHEAYAGYGCNMALRVSALHAHGLRFDEALPLYSWLEDVDFSRRLAPFGRLVRAGTMRGVHLGTKRGRTPGKLLGYSQIANPIYLLRKGSITRRHARELIVRSLGSNLLRTLRPRPWVDYRGRLWGNLIAAADVLRGRDSPDRILDLKR
jgi:hypothetical protein